MQITDYLETKTWTPLTAPLGELTARGPSSILVIAWLQVKSAYSSCGSLVPALEISVILRHTN